jgi:hypothetical protein
MFVSFRGAACAVLFSVFTLGMAVSPAHAQSPAGQFEIGPNLSVLRVSELDTTDVGVGVDAAWHLTPRLAIDGTLSWFPGSGDEPSLKDQRRVLGLIGVRSGVTRGGIDFYGRGRVGFLNFAESGPFPCVLIFPAPLTCQLAQGYTAFAVDFGGGATIPVDADGRWKVRVDVGDLLVRYDMEAMRKNNERTDGFLSHNLLFTAGLVFKF